jgi:hypothetical protein
MNRLIIKLRNIVVNIKLINSVVSLTLSSYQPNSMTAIQISPYITLGFNFERYSRIMYVTSSSNSLEIITTTVVIHI